MKVETLTKGLVTAALAGLVMGTATPAFAKTAAKGEKAVKCAKGEHCECDHKNGEKCEKCEKCSKDGCGKEGNGKEGCGKNSCEAKKANDKK